jgi:hypothetical protein
MNDVCLMNMSMNRSQTFSNLELPNELPNESTELESKPNELMSDNSGAVMINSIKLPPFIDQCSCK